MSIPAHPAISKGAPLDPSNNYGNGAIHPDAVSFQADNAGIVWVALDEGERTRWFNCHAPNGFDLHGFGIRWELSAWQIEEECLEVLRHQGKRAHRMARRAR